jgi:hypothetical protein
MTFDGKVARTIVPFKGSPWREERDWWEGRSKAVGGIRGREMIREVLTFLHLPGLIIWIPLARADARSVANEFLSFSKTHQSLCKSSKDFSLSSAADHDRPVSDIQSEHEQELQPKK